MNALNIIFTLSLFMGLILAQMHLSVEISQALVRYQFFKTGEEELWHKLFLSALKHPKINFNQSFEKNILILNKKVKFKIYEKSNIYQIKNKIKYMDFQININPLGYSQLKFCHNVLLNLN